MVRNGKRECVKKKWGEGRVGGGKRRWESVSEATQFSLVRQNRLGECQRHSNIFYTCNFNTCNNILNWNVICVIRCILLYVTADMSNNGHVWLSTRDEMWEQNTDTSKHVFHCLPKTRTSQNTDEVSKQPHRMLVQHCEASLNLCLCIIFFIQIVLI